MSLCSVHVDPRQQPKHCRDMKNLIFALLFVPTSTVAQEAAQVAFEQIAIAERQEVQAILKVAGLYEANVDGRWGPSTATSLLEAAEKLAAVGIHYSLDDAQGASDIIAFVRSDAGRGFFAEGGLCQECEYEYMEGDEGGLASDTTSTVEPLSVSSAGFFRQKSADAGDYVVRLGENPLYDRVGYCHATLGSFSDGISTVRISVDRSTRGWAITLRGDQNLNPPLFAPRDALSRGEVLPMSSTFENINGEWVTSFSNAHGTYMDQIEGNLISLSVNQGSDRISIEVPRLPKLVEDFRLCAEEEEIQHRRKYCALLLQPDPSSTHPHDISMMEYCAEPWGLSE
jgi:hypothetical protein